MDPMREKEKRMTTRRVSHPMSQRDLQDGDWEGRRRGRCFWQKIQGSLPGNPSMKGNSCQYACTLHSCLSQMRFLCLNNQIYTLDHKFAQNKETILSSKLITPAPIIFIRISITVTLELMTNESWQFVRLNAIY